MKEGDRVRIKSNQYGHIPVGTLADVMEVSRYRTVKPICVVLDDDTEALYDEADLEVVTP